MIHWLSRSLFLLTCFSTPAIAQVKQVEIMGKQIVDDRVILRVQARDARQDPITSLKRDNFQLEVNDQPLSPENWSFSRPDEASPPPLRMIVLLDFSGSMKEPDGNGTKKFERAITGIRGLIQKLADRDTNQTKVNLVLFGKPSTGDQDKCSPDIKPKLFYDDNPNAAKLLSNDRFYSPSDPRLKEALEMYAKSSPCAATNLYSSITAAVKALRQTQPSGFNQELPQLAIILLSDGYDNQSPNERQAFEALSTLLQDKPKVWLHALGYGESPQDVGRGCGLNQAATRENVRGKIACEGRFMDQERLEQIADATGGIHTFSAAGDEIVRELETRFLNALRGQYELKYENPNPERGTRHSVKVSANQVSSQPESYTMTLFGREVKWQTRLPTVILAGALFLLAIVPFSLWARSLQSQKKY
ncbi:MULTISPECIES: VWA domain-containing protein [Leptolyngbya]|uniref:VWA domain-containing protein n=1 Tax=Leptolyngbya TaxID=47251 RepID=UPI000360A18F|nr:MULTISPECIES: VWA domain-containing protein [Leptolyngbya]MBD2371006.1 VWA domain-containing protein [Leptolyngbya sp. FACHB-161]MBD2377536.1 VWA domain-containing protein [Leptolyngbya sp. FACHB-238]MBD2401944.1 VWA domain-containing protein [Leptolyngbya sp. FACHB-239]MBD2408462.1 VWA domain-containing protein [Leptolyngbya sp. FACHB-402]ULP31100.1 VWA domain-containing protein [Leptolyngbya boryana IU 594]